MTILYHLVFFYYQQVITDPAERCSLLFCPTAMNTDSLNSLKKCYGGPGGGWDVKFHNTGSTSEFLGSGGLVAWKIHMFVRQLLERMNSPISHSSPWLYSHSSLGGFRNLLMVFYDGPSQQPDFHRLLTCHEQKKRRGFSGKKSPKSVGSLWWQAN